MLSIIPKAHAAVDATKFGNAINPFLVNIVNPIIGLMFGIALLVFSYGVLQLVWLAEDGAARSQAKAAVWGGLLGMFIMMSAWGLIYVISNTVKSL